MIGLNEPRLNSICVVKHKDNLYEFGIKTCSPCFGVLRALPRDLQERSVFPDNTQVVLYKIKKYLYPSKKKDKKLEDWKLFSPLKTRGTKKVFGN
jgi:hypothetical protein